MRLLPVAFVLVLLALPASAQAVPTISTSASAAPNPARTAQEVVISITAANSGSTAQAYPLYLRYELTGQSEFGVGSVECPPGATQTKFEECRVDAPLSPGQSVTMTVRGFSPRAGTTTMNATAFAYDDTNHGDDTVPLSIVVEGPTDDGSGVLGDGPAGGGPGAAQSAFAIPRPTMRSRFRTGRPITVTARLDRRAELAVVVEKQGRRGRWKRVRGVVRKRCAPGSCAVRFRLISGRALAPGSYRLALLATSQRGEHATSPRMRFRVTR
jgi:hypothetical protein